MTNMQTQNRTQAQHSYDAWIGHDAVDMNGDKIGEIKDIFYDDVTHRPEWVSIKTGMLGRQSIAPIAGAQVRVRETDGDNASTGSDSQLLLPFDKAKIKDAPDVGDDVDEGILSQADERELYQHYGFNYESTTPAGTYGMGYDKQARPDSGFTHRRWEPNRNEWEEMSDVERRVGTNRQTQEVPVKAEAKIPIEATVRLRRYQTQRTQTRQVEVPVTEEHVEVQDVDASANPANPATQQSQQTRS